MENVVKLATATKKTRQRKKKASKLNGQSIENDEKAAAKQQSEANSYEAPITPEKRKADTHDKETPPAKKAKRNQVFTLFVGNLNPKEDFETIKSEITKFFSREGLMIKNMRLSASRYFGHVDFASEEEIQKALELNGKNIMDQPVKLDRATSKSKLAFHGNKLLLNNLACSTTEDILWKNFPQAVNIRIPQEKGMSVGFAYVDFKSAKDAREAKMACKNTTIEGRTILTQYRPMEDRESKEAGQLSCSSNQVFIKNMSFNMTEESIQDVFEKAVAIRIPLNKGLAQKYAFLEFPSMDDARESLTICNKMKIQSRSINLELFQKKKGFISRANCEPTKTLIVQGLSEVTTAQTLKEVFEGSVSARIVTDRNTGFSKGFGFVEFNSKEDCMTAKEAMEDCEIQGSSVILEYAQPRTRVVEPDKTVPLERGDECGNQLPLQ